MDKIAFTLSVVSLVMALTSFILNWDNNYKFYASFFTNTESNSNVR